MNSAPTEQQVIDDILSSGPSQCLLANGTNLEKRVAASIFKQWKKWTDASSSDAPPPDYFSDKLKLMFDVLNVFDSEIEDNDRPRKTKNPILANESAVEKNIEKFMIDAGLQYDKKRIYCISEKDGFEYDVYHNYQNYCAAAKRAIGKHIEHLPLYQRNHPGYKCGLLVCDCAEVYIQVQNIIEMSIEYGKITKYKMHYPWFDKTLISPALRVGLDFLIWYMPYKKYSKDQPDGSNYPISVIIDLHYPQLQSKLKEYPSLLMRPL